VQVGFGLGWGEELYWLVPGNLFAGPYILRLCLRWEKAAFGTERTSRRKHDDTSVAPR
jgi:hypothetical protein